MNARKLQLFLSYSRDDKNYLQDLMPTLKRCERDFSVNLLLDRDIPKGVNWNSWITNAISSADIILCLVSANYLASEYILDNEIPLMKRRFDEEVPLIPIFVRSCRLDKDSIFFTTQGMNAPDKPISNMTPNERDIFFASLEQDISEIAQEVIQKRTWKPPISSGREESPQNNLVIHTDLETSMVTPRYNIVVVGRTGTGKSALINYLFGKKIRASSTGLPVTEPGFHRQDLEIDGIPSTTFDSWGLEVDTANEWLEKLDEELSQRGVDKPVTKWFHTVFYCIQASGHRVESADVRILRRFRDEKYNVIVALTKADAVSKKEISDLSSTIYSEVGNELVCIPVCSVEVETMTGKTKCFGLPELIAQIRRGFWASIMERVPSRCVSIICKHIDDESERLITFVSEETGFFNHKSVMQQVNGRLSGMVSELTRSDGIIKSTVSSEIENTLKLYKQFEKLVDYSFLLNDSTSPEKYVTTKFLTIPDGGNVLKGVLYGFSALELGQLVGGAGASLLGLSSLFTVIAAPVGIGIGMLALSLTKENFLESTIDKIREASGEIKMKVGQLEPELRRCIADTPMT